MREQVLFVYPMRWVFVIRNGNVSKRGIAIFYNSDKG